MGRLDGAGELWNVGPAYLASPTPATPADEDPLGVVVPLFDWDVGVEGGRRELEDDLDGLGDLSDDFDDFVGRSFGLGLRDCCARGEAAEGGLKSRLASPNV